MRTAFSFDCIILHTACLILHCCVSLHWSQRWPNFVSAEVLEILQTIAFLKRTGPKVLFVSRVLLWGVRHRLGTFRWFFLVLQIMQILIFVIRTAFFWLCYHMCHVFYCTLLTYSNWSQRRPNFVSAEVLEIFQAIIFLRCAGAPGPLWWFTCVVEKC